MSQSAGEPVLRGRRIGLSYEEAGANLFSRDLVQGIREAANARGVSVIAREYKNSVERQLLDIDDLLAGQVDALIVSAADSVAVGPAISRAQSQGIPVFTVDHAVRGHPVVSHVASDNLLGGRLAAEFLDECLDSRGEVAIVGFQPNGATPGAWAATSIAERIDGFKQTLANRRGLLLVEEVSGGESREGARQATLTLLQSHPRLNGIFAVNDVMVGGVLDALREKGCGDGVMVVGYDATPQGCAEILRGGPLRGEVAQFPERIGHTVVELWSRHVQGKAVPERLEIPVEMVTRENVQQFTGAERLLHVRRGEVWTAGERVMFFPVRGYQMLLNEIHAASPDLLRHIIYRSGFVLGKSIAEQVREIYPDPRDHLFVLLEDLARSGFGTFELVELDLEAGEAIIRGQNLFEAAIAPDLAWVRTPRCVDNYCSGRLAGYLTAMLGRTATCEEILCEARGDPYCQFAVTVGRPGRSEHE